MLELRDGSCYPEAVVGVNVGLACVDGVIAFIAFYQVISNSISDCCVQLFDESIIGIVFFN